MGRRRRIITTSAEQTCTWGKILAKDLKRGDVCCLFGDLAAGKTTLIKGIIEELTQISSFEVTSPTYTYLQSYDFVHHFDLYRLQGVEDFLQRGFDEYLQKGICCIEWSERITSLIPENALCIEMFHEGENRRRIEIGPLCEVGA